MSIVSTKPKGGKIVEATKKAIDALPKNSGEWRIAGFPGFYVRSRESKKYRVLKRVKGDLVPFNLTAATFKDAKAEYHDIWNDLELKPAPGSVLTLGPAIESFVERIRSKGPLSDKTKHIHRDNAKRFLADWADRPLVEIVKDRLALRRLQEHISSTNGHSTSNQVQKLLQATYNWHQAVDPTLTLAWPIKAVVIHDIAPRKWAFKKDDDLRAFWTDIQRKKLPVLDGAGKPVLNKRGKPATAPTGPPILIGGEPVQIGVSALGSLKKMFWLLTLFTGARNSTVRENPRAEFHRELKVIHFVKNKGNPAYTVPLADVVVELLDRYLASESIPASEWLFPSPVKIGKPLGHVKEVDDLGVVSSHRLRHHFRTELGVLGASDDQIDLLTGHAPDKRDVNAGYFSITPRVIESLRPLVNEVAASYLKVIPEIRDTTF